MSDNEFQIIKKTLGQLINEQAQNFPDNEILVYPDRNFRLTYKEFVEEADKIAKGLIALGIKKGDHVAVWAQNVPHWIIFMFALSKIGAALLTINTGYQHNELEFVLKQSDSVAIALTDNFKGNDFLKTLYDVVPEIKKQPRGYLNSEKFPFLKNVISLGQEKHRGTYNLNELVALGETLISDEELKQRENDVDPDDVVNMQYTSGTTGFPKGVMLSHINILNNGFCIGENMKYTDKDRLCLTVPLFHCFGCVLGVMAVTTHAATMVILESFNPLHALVAVHKEKCTSIYGVPTMFISELNLPTFEMFDLTSLRTGIMAGSVCPEPLLKRVMKEMHCTQITSVYGLTEASPGITQSSADDTPAIRAASVGKKLPKIEVKIINPETLEELGDYEQGELCCRGYNVMKGYYNNPEENKKIFLSDGWLRSGDIAYRDENGYFFITGRHKDIIIRGGENISPKEIEDLIITIDGISNCQVVAAPSKKYGEEIAAFIIRDNNSDIVESDIKDFCKGKIANFKIPKYIEFVEEYPLTASGKIQKFKLRDIIKEKVSI